MQSSLSLGLLAHSVWNSDFGPGFWLLGLATAFFYGVALAMNPARLALEGVPTEAVRRALSQLVCSGAPLGLLLVAIFAMVFTQVVDPDVEPLLSRPAVVIEWGYVSGAIVLLTFLAIAGPLIFLLKTLLQASP